MKPSAVTEEAARRHACREDVLRYEALCAARDPGKTKQERAAAVRRVFSVGPGCKEREKRNGKEKKEEDGVAQCWKCKGWNTQSTSVQTRGADEGQTTFVQCLNNKCKNRWKMG